MVRVEFHHLALQVLNSAILVVFSVSVRFLQLVCLAAFMEFIDSQSYFMCDSSHCLQIHFYACAPVTATARGIMFLDYLSVCPILMTVIYKECLEETSSNLDSKMN